MTRLLVGLIFVALPLTLAAQQRDRVNGNFNNTRFQEFALQIESQTDFHFYYRLLDVDSVFVTVNATNDPVEKVLEQALTGSSLQFNIHEANIYITKDHAIMTSLPVDFFNQGVKTEARENFDYSEYEKSEKQQRAAEEKLHLIGTKTADLSGEATLTGTVTDEKTGEAIIGASVYVENPTIGVATDPFGRYSLKLPRGRHELLIKSVGMKLTRRRILLYNNGRLDVELQENIIPLKEVLVESERDVRVTGMQMGVEKLDIKVMKQMPLALGETDIMKVVLALPGVQSVGEGTVGLNVRGGATSQNLILFNDAAVYNPSHMFGFFSTFNPDVLKSVELYKSGITADYGGRISSVLDVHSREGNLKKLSGSGGLSPVTGRLMLEGPILKEKASFLIGVRSTYSDWILKRLNTDRLRNSSAGFYDLTMNLNYKVNENNTIIANGYMSQDRFQLNADTAYAYSDKNASLKWKHVFNQKLFSVFTGSVSKYNYQVISDQNPVNAFNMNFNIRQGTAKADFTYFQSPKHTFTGGVSSTFYGLQPGRFLPYGEESLVKPDILQNDQGIENAVYIGDNYDITTRTSLYLGLRYSLYQNLGAKDVYQYRPGAPLQEVTMVDTVHFGKGKPTATYSGFEPRAAIRHILTKSSSVKLSFNRLRQYIQMLSNTIAITPTDVWKLSDAYIPPQIGNQVSLGFYKNFKGNLIETSLEAYYKTIENATDYKSGAQLLKNHHLETDVIKADGKAYGVELLIKKSLGKVNGWISYTWSRSFLRTNGTFDPEIVNQGNWYPSNYDKPHAFNFIGNFKVSRRFNFSLNTVYSTGRPITIPISKYQIAGADRVFYGPRNGNRIPDYFRIDLSVNIEGNHKIKKLAHSSWTLAVYNLTGRNNAYSVYFVSNNGVIKGYLLSIFAQPIPTVTYNFKF
ncbi:MAG TPA: TonB-dependent receptor [Cyclobacteriaceae bacterium]|nr:TonB-dependent receptor [Cyclobacteriaceae bacterium]